MKKFIIKFQLFASGIVAHSAVTSLLQDYAGKDQYLLNIENGWVDSAVTIPIAMLLLGFSIYELITEKVIVKTQSYTIVVESEEMAETIKTNVKKIGGDIAP